MIHKLLSILFIAIMCSILSCSTTPPNQQQNNKQLFTQLYNRLERNKFVAEDSLIQLYKTIDTVSLNNSVEIEWLSLFIKGRLFYTQSNYVKSLQYYNLATTKIKNTPSLDSLLIRTYIGLGLVYTQQSNYEKALEIFIKAKRKAELYASENALITISINMTNVYIAMGKSKEGIEEMNSVIKKSSLIPKLNAMHVLANCYGEKGLIDSALAIDNRAALLGKEYPLLLSPIYNNKALCFVEQHKMDSAFYYFKKSFAIDSLNKHERNMNANLQLLGEIYEANNDNVNAELSYKKAAKAFEKLGDKRNLVGVLVNLSQLNIKRNDWKTAYTYSESANNIKNEINNLKLANNIEVLNLEYETEKKNNTIALQHQKLADRNKTIFSLITMVVLILLLGLFAYKNYKAKSELKLQEQKQSATLSIIEAGENERRRIAQDLHDNMGAHTTSILAQIDRLNTSDVANIKYGALRTDAENIMAMLRETIWILKTKTISIHNFYDLVKSYANKQLKNTLNISVVYKENITEQRQLSPTITLNLYRVIQESIQNIIKHANATHVLFTVDATPQLTITISDNGKGFDFAGKENKSGLENMQFRANEINYTLTINSTLHTGTTIHLTENI